MTLYPLLFGTEPFKVRKYRFSFCFLFSHNIYSCCYVLSKPSALEHEGISTSLQWVHLHFKVRVIASFSFEYLSTLGVFFLFFFYYLGLTGQLLVLMCAGVYLIFVCWRWFLGHLFTVSDFIKVCTQISFYLGTLDLTFVFKPLLQL